MNNIKEIITFFKEKNNKSEKRSRKYKTLTTILKSFDLFVFIATTSSSITLSFTGIGFLALAVLTATVCGSSIGNNVIYEVIKNKYKKYKKQNEKINKQLNLLMKYTKNFAKLIYLIKMDMNLYVILLLNMLMKQKWIFLMNMKIKVKLNFFSHNKLKFQPTT